MSIPTLADHLAGTAKPAPRAEPTRVHRMGDGPAAPEHLPKGSTVRSKVVFPPVTPTPNPATITRQEEPMPKGHYPRKPKATGEEAGKPRAKKATKRARKSDGQPVGAASFVIDDRGGMEIRDGQQSIQLERADVQRLTTFLDRTKGIRA